mgnify:CR=1 FL=1
MEGLKKRDLKKEVMNMLASKPKLAKSNDFVNKMYKENKNLGSKTPIKIVSISDLHIDYEYT